MDVFVLLATMFVCFIIGVPIAYSLALAAMAGALWIDIPLEALMLKISDGVSKVAMLTIPFFVLAGAIMAEGGMARRLVAFADVLVGFTRIRGGLSVVNVLATTFLSGISGSSVADVAVLSRTIAHDMAKEGYDRAFTAALIASASTMANLIPPSIMAVVYGATGDVSIGGLFLAGVVPGVLIGIGLMIYSYFFGPTGVMKKRAPFTEVVIAARGSALPLVIPVIIMGGILTGWFTPTEAGMVAAIYILVVLIPALNRAHIRELPRDFMYAGLLYSLPLGAVAGASAFGWMVAYLRGPDIVAGYITAFAGNDGAMIMFLLVVLFVIVGDFIDAVPAIIIFMPIIRKLAEVGNINPLHMGVVIITTLVFGLITPPYGLSLLVASKYVGVGFGKAVIRSLPLYIVFFLTIAFTVMFPKVVLWLPKQLLPESVGCFKSPAGTGYICP